MQWEELKETLLSKKGRIIRISFHLYKKEKQNVYLYRLEYALKNSGRRGNRGGKETVHF